MKRKFVAIFMIAIMLIFIMGVTYEAFAASESDKKEAEDLIEKVK